MDSKPLFSVLVANFNKAQFIKECLDSLLAQTFKNFEVIIVDDASTDNSLEVINDFVNKDARFKLFENKENKGVGFTKKRMIGEASADICGILDSDDYLAENAFQKMYEAHLQNPEASIIYSSTVYFDEKGKIENVFQKTIQQPHNTSVIDKLFVSHFVTFKRDLYLKTKGINPYLKGAEDLELYILLEEKGTIIHLDENLYFHRIYDGGISQGNNKGMVNDWAFYVQVHHLMRRGNDIKPIFELYKNWYKYDVSVFSNWDLIKMIIYRLTKSFRKS